MKRTQTLLFITAALLLAACTPASMPQDAPMPGLTPPALIVYITDEDCPSLEIESGFTVGWRNTGKRVHILQSQLQEDGSRIFDAGTLQPGDGFAMTFTAPGTIPYVCSEDGSLKGLITVTAPTAMQEAVRPDLGSGVAQSCLLTQQGEVFCWGQGARTGQEISPDTFGKPFRMEGLDAISLGVGWYHTCAATRERQVKCWGQNSYGQLGNGTTQDSSLPVDTVDLEEVTAVTAGATHSCALTSTGEVYCWGQNAQGQVSDGTRTDRPAPVQVSGLGGPAASISAGMAYTCAILVDGQVECWGQFTFLPEGQNQQIHTTPESIPVQEGDLEKIAAGDYHLCLLNTSRQVLCAGALFPSNDPIFSQPLESLGKLQGQIQDILAGTGFTCVLPSSGEVFCWGDNYFDQIGDGTFLTVAEPKQVSRAGNEVVALGGGHYTACALALDGKVICWGDTSFGQTGDGTAQWKDAAAR